MFQSNVTPDIFLADEENTPNITQVSEQEKLILGMYQTQYFGRMASRKIVRRHRET